MPPHGEPGRRHERGATRSYEHRDAPYEADRGVEPHKEAVMVRTSTLGETLWSLSRNLLPDHVLHDAVLGDRGHLPPA